MKTTKLIKPSQKDLLDILLAPASSKTDVLLYENGNMSDLIDIEDAEKIRKLFLENSTKVKQITNNDKLEAFTNEHTDFASELMQFRFVPESVYKIREEVVIFDNIVGIYSKEKMVVIEDDSFAENQRELFMSIWDQGVSPKLGFEYKPNHSFYRNLDCFVDGKQVIVWPDAEAIGAYKGFSKSDIEKYISEIIESDEYFSDATYYVVFIWDMDGDKMADIWKMNENYVDDRSGPLSEGRVYREGVLTTDLGLASGNTLLVLGYEEKMRRQSKDLNGYLQGPPPKLPLEVYNGKNFFDYN